MKKHVYVDIHGVLADFAGHAMKWYDIPGTLEDITHWMWIIERFLEKYPTRTVNDFWLGLYPTFWITVPFTDKANYFRSLIRAYCSDFTLLTVPSRNSAGSIQRWIEEKLPEQFYAGDYIITPRKERVSAPGRLLIDDHEVNCKAWEQAGGEAILVPRPWNVNRGLPVIETVHKGLELFYAN